MTNRTAIALGLALVILASQSARRTSAAPRRSGSASVRVDATRKSGNESAKVTIRITVKFRTPFALITRRETLRDLTVKKGAKPVKTLKRGKDVVYVVTAEWTGKNSVKVVADMTSKYGKASATRLAEIREGK